ncbi:unnamed protein product [Schistocephalus solidus]|uniref:Reverse transcriptase domain-containing protein n=1 Tax=Schistocephalus solidus TaxID=70667 RepID=A0A183T2V7_SCHSO|nr:unnamed protein product [Schistocephalus solidus]
MRSLFYTTFVELKKDFDMVNFYGLWNVMQIFGCPERFTHIVRQLHDRMMARVTENWTVSEAFSVTNGVTHGCVLVPTLLSLMFLAMLMDAYRDEQPGIRIAYRTDGHLLKSRRVGGRAVGPSAQRLRMQMTSSSSSSSYSSCSYSSSNDATATASAAATTAAKTTEELSRFYPESFTNPRLNGSILLSKKIVLNSGIKDEQVTMVWSRSSLRVKLDLHRTHTCLPILSRNPNLPNDVGRTDILLHKNRLK